MANVVFVTWAGGGNLPPAFGIAADLAVRGDFVQFLGDAGQRHPHLRLGSTRRRRDSPACGGVARVLTASMAAGHRSLSFAKLVGCPDAGG
ncbi:MAG TPA: hypothetical protein VGO88_02105 [Mycetocola sp.]|jgi:hypothetical protein|nr:hypothetical protein [Mycetocola sp.]